SSTFRPSRRPPRFPYTPLFRSHVRVHLGLRGLAAAQRGAECREGGVELPAVLGAGRAAGALRALSGVRGGRALAVPEHAAVLAADRKSTRLHSSHASISYAVFC